MAPSKHLLLFGDQSVEKLTAIQALVRTSRTVPAARRFLQEATDVIQLEFSRLGRQEHGWDKTLDSLLGLAEEYDSSDGDNIIVSTALACTGRLGQLICHADEDPTILGSCLETVDIVALCGGLLPGAVAMAAKDTSQLFSLSRVVISVAIRLAYEVSQRMKLVEDAPKSWGRTYTGLSRAAVQDILNRFHEDQGIPEFRRISIGVVAEYWLTLIGPPSSLERLESWSSDIRNASHIRTDVTGPIHTKFAPRVDVAKILGGSALLDHPIDHTKARMFSPGSCKQYKHLTLGALLGEVLEDIAHNVLHVTDLIQASVSTLAVKRNVKLSVMGPTNHLSAMKLALQAHGVEYSINEPAAATPSENIRGGSDLIAIVGMAGRFPGSETVEGFWEDLVAGKCHIKEVPKSRFDLDAFYDAMGEKKNSTTARHGAFLDNPGLFDHRLFNVSPREAAQMDPGHRLILTVAYEALQAAGYSPDGSLANGSSRIASYFGQAADEWRDILNQQGADIYYVPGFSRAFGVGRLNYHFNWSGGAFSLDTACSTSATAVSLACSALMARECDMALAGGNSVINSPTTSSGLSRAGMLSTTGGCRTYHDDADGYARAEGAGVVVLKRLEDAVSDNDNILAVVRGSARMHSPTATSMTHPSAASQEAIYKEVLRQSGLNADEVAYVEMHGTGTQAGDVEEMTSVVNTFANQRKRDNPLTIGAVKAAVGHGEGASGVTSLIKAIMMLRERVIPPQPGWPFKLNPSFPPLAQLNVKISTKTSPLRASPKGGDRKIKMLVNSFDASGGNTSLAIEEAPPRPVKSEDVRAWHVIAISARTATSLQNNRERLLEYLERRPDTKLSDLAYTTTARRMHEPLRLAYTGSSIGDIVSQLRADVNKQTQVPKTKPKPRSRVFLFAGQGSHYAGMGADLFRGSKAFRETLLSYQDMVTMVGLPYFIDLISEPGLGLSGQSTVKVQLATVALEIALTHVMKLWGVTPDVVIGHSLGEYAALCVAGVLSVSDALFLVGSRASLMEKRLVPNTYAMLVTSTTEQSLDQTFRELELGSCNIACVNAPSITVASGNVEEISRLQRHMGTKGERTTFLPVPYGFHSDQIQPVLGELQQIARGVVFSKPQIPIVSTLTGQVEREASAFSPAYLARQARQKVNLVGALGACQAAGLCDDNSLWLDLGPEPHCLGAARKTLDIPIAQALPMLKSGDNNWKIVSYTLKRAYESGVSVNWTEFHKSFKDSVTLLSLPLYAFDSRDFWTPYIEPVHPTGDAGKAEVALKKTRKFLTTSLQYVDDERIEGQTVKAEFTSNISDPHLLETIRGHVVNGQTICPLGVFHDMALTAAKYVYRKLHNQSKLPSMSLRKVDMTQALVISETTLDSVICVTSSYHADDQHADIEFRSKQGDKVSLHGKCQVVFDTNPTWNLDMSQTFLLSSRMNSLKEQAVSGRAHRLLKPVVYQLFSGVVSYSSTYQALEEVVMDADCNDAIGTVKLPDMSGLGQFHLSPYWVDAVIHLAGFVVNSGLKYSQDIACLATGFDSWRSVKDLSAGETYTVYVCMQEISNSHFIQGDCYVFQGKELVQATLGIKFLKLKKIALGAILGNPGTPREQSTASRPDALDSTKQAPRALSILNKDRVTVRDHRVVESYPRHETPKLPEPSTTINKRAAERAVTSGPASTETIQSVLSIVAAESGCNMDEMTDDTRYMDLGIDSVMAITILVKVARQVDLDLPAAFFLENETIGDSKRALQILLNPEMEMEVSPESDTEQQEMEPPSTPGRKASEQTLSTWPSPMPMTPAWSIDLDQEASFVEPVYTAQSSREERQDSEAPIQPRLVSKVIQYRGAKSSDSHNLFFVAGETGSTFEYIHLPQLGPNLGVYGVESPLTGNAADTDIDIEELANVYKTAIQNEQPSGPYILGGLSAGAVLAFEVARQFLEDGEEVEGLLLLDCDSTRVQNSTTTSHSASLAWFMKPGQEKHIKKIVSLCAAYKPTPVSASQCPKLSVQIVAKNRTSSLEWTDRIPGLQTRESGIESGSFLKPSMVNSLSLVCQEVVEKMRT